ncbi:MAG: DUF401 family protein [Planctomycetota bacterium]
MIIKVLGSLALILVINALCRQLLVSVLLGTLGLALWCGHSAGATWWIAWERFSSADNLCLMVVILQVTWLSGQMSSAGVMKDLVEAVRLRISRRASMAVLPAVIGFLPMPGGALFSAPLVDECDPNHDTPSLLKAQTNYWFRHIWEYWWPLYPAVLLALDITGLEVWRFMLLQVPFSFVAVAVGYWFLLRKVGGEESRSSGNGGKKADSAHETGQEIHGDPTGKKVGQAPESHGPALLPLVAPIVVIISVYAAISLFLPSLAHAQKYLPMIIGIVLAMVFLQVQRPLDRGRWRSLLLSKKTLMMAVLVAAVQVYGAYIEADLPDGTPLVEMMRTELAQWGIPPLAMMIILPFVAGFTTGIAIAFVGASLPIVVSLMGDHPAMGYYLGSISLAYICGYAGMILSPVHICLIVTNEFFKTRLYPSIAGLVKPVAVLMATALIYYLILR